MVLFIAIYEKYRDIFALIDLDDKDQSLIGILQEQGKSNLSALAEQVHLSVSAVSRRVQRLELAGVIRGYRADIDQTKLGLGLTVFVEISLRQQTDEAFDSFEAAILHHPQIQSCHMMSGDSDYLLKALVPDARGFERLHRKVLAKLPFVDRIRSSFAIRAVR